NTARADDACGYSAEPVPPRVPRQGATTHAIQSAVDQQPEGGGTDAGPCVGHQSLREGLHGGRRPKSLEGGNRGGVCAGGSVGIWGLKVRFCATWPLSDGTAGLNG